MEFWEVVRKRRSIRLYSDAPVSSDVVARLIAAVVAAPSAWNAQPAHLHVATGDSLHRVRQAMSMSTMHLGEYLDVLDPEKLQAAENFFGALGNAPMAVAISVPVPEDDLTRINSYLAAGCALENLLLAATAEGLGACSLTATFFVRDSLDQIFELGEEREILTLVLIGHAGEEPAAPEHGADIVTFHGVSATRSRAVLFDVGNTLLYPFPSVSHVCREILATAGHEHDLEAIEELMPLVDAYYEDRYQADDTFWTSEKATSDVWVGMYSLLCRRLGIENEAEDLARAVYDEFGKAEHWRAFDDVPAAFDRLRASGYRLGVLSNWDGRLSGILEGLGLAQRLDTIVCSADVGLHKPDPRIFALACERLGVAPGDAVHVGDHPYADVLGATAAGIPAVLIARAGTPPPATAPVIRSLDELDALLEG